MSEGSFPHSIPEESDSLAEEPATRPFGRLLDFPADEATAESPADRWVEDANSSMDGPLLRPASADADRGGELVVFPRTAITEKRLRPAEVSGTQKTHAPIVATPTAEALGAEADRPKYLASELLREDLTPASPMKRTLRYGSLGLGALGVAVALALGGTGTFPLVFAGLFAVVAVAGLLPIPPRWRGLSVALAGLTGAGITTYLETRAGEAAAPLLTGCVVLGASGLFYRAAHRESKVARIIAGLGVAATTLFLGFSGGVEALVVEDLEWQSWVAPAVRFGLVAISLGAVLTFLDPRGHGGAWVAGGALLSWMVLYSASRFLLEALPSRGPTAFSVLTDPASVGPLTLPLFTTLAAAGLAQVFAWLVKPRRA